MSGGEWLFHAPESFLQHVVALKIYSDLDYELFIDASGDKVALEMEPRRGRRPAEDSKRADISIWYKSEDKLRAIIEIKRTMSLDKLVRSDVDKLQECLKGKSKNLTAGYLLVYSEILKTNNNGDLKYRFKKIG